MATRALWWLAAACALSACGAEPNFVTWPACYTDRTKLYVKGVVEPGQYDSTVRGIYIEDCINFTTVHLGSLRIYPNLKRIHISGYKVDDITFESLTNLQSIYMQSSGILGKNLPSNLFRNCPRLSVLNLSFNNMAGTPADLLQGLDQMEVLICDYCSLREVPSFFTSQTFPIMKQLSLDHNEISDIKDPTTFANAVTLVILSLENNRIGYLHSDLIKPLTQIQQVRLSNNKLRYISEDFFRNKPALRYVKLSNNLIEYVPSNAFVGTNLRYLYLDNNSLTHLPPNFLSNIQTTQSFYFYANPWDCASLNNIIVWANKYNKDYYNTHLSGQLQACMIIDNYQSLVN